MTRWRPKIRDPRGDQASLGVRAVGQGWPARGAERSAVSWCGALATLLLVSFGSSLRADEAESGAPTAEDSRLQIVRLVHDHQLRGALEAVDDLMARDPAGAGRLGLAYLRGHLLLRLERRTEAFEAFAGAMSSTPTLEPWSRFHLAREQLEMGSPEVAAGLLAGLLGGGPPTSLATPATHLFQRAIVGGGDCRLLRNLDRVRLSTANRRRLLLGRAHCALRQDDLESGYQLLLALLDDETQDPVAFEAALLLAQTLPGKLPPRTHLLIGLAFYEHREFEMAIGHLAQALVQLSSSRDISEREAFECRYALARSHFWLGRYLAAAEAFASIAESTASPRRKAQVLYQRARSLELVGDWGQAIGIFQQAYRAEPAGRWSDAALIAILRLRWLSGDEAGALAAFEALNERRQYETTSRALLFMAASDLVRGLGERPAGWLDHADRLGRVSDQEIAFWRGRLGEVRQRPAEAVVFYVQTLVEGAHHPLAQAARERLDQPSLAVARSALVAEKLRSSRPADLYAAWLAIPQGEGRRGVRARLEERLGADATSGPFLRLSASPMADWPLWQNSFKSPEELILGLGLFDEAEARVLRHFPVAEPGLALAGSLALSASGAHRRSLYIAEILVKRAPDTLPPDFLPTAFRQLLYPFGYNYLILREAGRQKVDPFLLAGIIREESRFDPGAFSGAAARGLTQFVLPTAREIAEVAGLEDFEPDDLAKPEVSIMLGAAYLARLHDDFEGRLYQMVAAYNAGEPQAMLWARYCQGDEPAEYLTKVAFRETRGYLAKVLTSRSQYRELYGPRDDAASLTSAPPRRQD